MRGISKRDFLIGASGLGVGAFASYFSSRYWLFNHTQAGKQHVLQVKQEELERRLLPIEGRALPIVFSEASKRLVEEGVIDLKKWNELYSKRKLTVPDWIGQSLLTDSRDPIQMDPVSAPFLLNILWALGISNKTQFNQKSPLQGKRLARFASTGGWKLGKEKNGAAYFNKVANIALNEDQEQLVHQAAKSIYRPCCNNSTFFQDCNHGSAMLGLLQLGASQGKSEEELYAAALIANLYWFPGQYSKMALYFQEIEDKNLMHVPARDVLSKKFSSGSGFNGNVVRKLAAKDLLPGSRRRGSQGCSV
jgi:hypothetical protein